MRKCVVGLGPGRCGGKSLAAFLDQQKYSHVTHEGVKLSNIPGVHPRVDVFEDYMGGRIFGDVATYWRWHIDWLLTFPDLVIVMLFRDIYEVTTSFYDYMSLMVKYQQPVEGTMLRSYPVNSTEFSWESINRSVLEYVSMMNAILANHSDRVFPMWTPELNSTRKMGDLLHCLQLPEEDWVLDLHHLNTQEEKQRWVEEEYGNLDNRSERSG